MNDTKNGAVTVLIPAHNEGKSIGTTVRRIKELHPDFEVLVVGDGSTDKTMRVAMDAGAHVFWPHPDNIGNAVAIKSGLRVASVTAENDVAVATGEMNARFTFHAAR